MENKSIPHFFGLTILFTLPAYILIALTGMNIILSPEMVFSFIPLCVLAPLGAASYLSYKESGWVAVKKLLARAFDYKRIKEKKGNILALLLMPILFLISWGIATILGMELLPPEFDSWSRNLLFSLCLKLIIATTIAEILFFSAS